ncbi:MAG: hypothetical protein H7210_08860 [Pyrinomonadaceae bacterium]|nr:hypothetical protein [Phycisphaerales bacterium]
MLRYDATSGAFAGQFAGAPGQPISGPAFLTIVPTPGTGFVVLLAAGFHAAKRRR